MLWIRHHGDDWCWAKSVMKAFVFVFKVSWGCSISPILQMFNHQHICPGSDVISTLQNTGHTAGRRQVLKDSGPVQHRQWYITRPGAWALVPSWWTTREQNLTCSRRPQQLRQSERVRAAPLQSILWFSAAPNIRVLSSGSVRAHPAAQHRSRSGAEPEGGSGVRTGRGWTELDRSFVCSVLLSSPLLSPQPSLSARCVSQSEALLHLRRANHLGSTNLPPPQHPPTHTQPIHLKQPCITSQVQISSKITENDFYCNWVVYIYIQALTELIMYSYLFIVYF